jgi:hypothetical protein
MADRNDDDNDGECSQQIDLPGIVTARAEFPPHR